MEIYIMDSTKVFKKALYAHIKHGNVKSRLIYYCPSKLILGLYREEEIRTWVNSLGTIIALDSFLIVTYSLPQKYSKCT